jgi:hypothetical protein
LQLEAALQRLDRDVQAAAAQAAGAAQAAAAAAAAAATSAPLAEELRALQGKLGYLQQEVQQAAVQQKAALQPLCSLVKAKVRAGELQGRPGWRAQPASLPSGAGTPDCSPALDWLTRA